MKSALISAGICLLLCSGVSLAQGAVSDVAAVLPLQNPQWRGPTDNWHAPRTRGQWWQAFGSSELVALLADAHAANPGLLAARAAVDEARATVAQNDSKVWPQLSLTATAQRESGVSAHSVGPTLSYQSDLWGAVSAQRQAAQSRLDAANASLDAVALKLDGTLARQYFQLLLLDQQQILSGRKLALMMRRLDILRHQLQLGAVASRDEAELVQAISQQQSTLGGLRLSSQQAYNALAVLCGKAPQDFRPQGSPLATLQLPYPSETLPGAMLLRRPDIRAADATLAAVQGDVAAAHAALYPSLTLSWQGVFSSAAGGPLQWVNTAAATLAAPLFDGGKLRAGLALSEAQYQAQLQLWRSTVLTALQEADDALHGLATSQQQWRQQQSRVDAAQRVAQIDEQRYRLGALDRASLLAAQEDVLAAELDSLAAHHSALAASVTLYQALGGAAEP